MSFSTDIHRRKKHVSLSDQKRFIRIEDEIRTRVKNELHAKQKESINLVASESNKGFFQEEEFQQEESEFEEPEHTEEGVQEDWQVIQLSQVRSFY